MLPRELRQTLAESELRCAHAEGDEDPEMVPSRGSGFLSAGFWHCFLRGRPAKLEMKNRRHSQKTSSGSTEESLARSREELIPD